MLRSLEKKLQRRPSFEMSRENEDDYDEEPVTPSRPRESQRMTRRDSRGNNRRVSMVGDAGLRQLTSFSPALSLWELIELPDIVKEATTPASWCVDAALLFVDISGFTNLCTKLSVDCLQGHINRYFSLLIDVIVRSHGDVLRFAGDAVLCAWCVQEKSAASTLALCSKVACACALELIEKCGVYPIPELPGVALSIHLGVGVSNMQAFRMGIPERWELLVYGDAVVQVEDSTP